MIANSSERIPPVLLLGFNRPEHAARVLERITQARPAALYVACDGPRPDRPDDRRKVADMQALARRLDGCPVHTLFRERNLGCGAAVSEAITWFLRAVGEGIILEDDCLPDPSFFPFCAELLARYRWASNVMQVAGYNLLSGRYDPGTDYFFSHFGWQWGWATWKRAWDHFDLRMASWPDFKARGYASAHPFYPQRVWVFDTACEGRIDTWDYQWHYACAAHSGLSVVPRHSLTQNIGFGPDATHGVNSRDGDTYRVPMRGLHFPLRHPPFLFADPRYDRQLIRAVHGGSPLKALFFRPSRLRRRYFPRQTPRPA